jgi:hypothetical protein
MYSKVPRHGICVYLKFDLHRFFLIILLSGKCATSISLESEELVKRFFNDKFLLLTFLSLLIKVCSPSSNLLVMVWPLRLLAVTQPRLFKFSFLSSRYPLRSEKQSSSFLRIRKFE